MKYIIISGDYETILDRNSVREAANDAISLWKLKTNKPDLAQITTVVDPQNKEIYLKTTQLFETI